MKYSIELIKLSKSGRAVSRKEKFFYNIKDVKEYYNQAKKEFNTLINVKLYDSTQSPKWTKKCDYIISLQQDKGTFYISEQKAKG